MLRDMKNFFRALRYSWAYRKRLVLSIVCATFAGILWGANLSAVYPVLKLLTGNTTLQNWVGTRIKDCEGEIDRLNHRLDDLHAKYKTVQELPPSNYRIREEQDVSGKIAADEDRLSSASDRLWRYHQLNRHIIRFLPDDTFDTLAILLVCVIGGVAIKGVFEFGQEYLVGHVANRTLFDLRNQFYRVAIHQDLRQSPEGGSAELMARFTNDLEQVGNGMKLLYGRVIAEPLRILSCMFIACMINWRLTLLFMILVPIAMLILTKTSRMMKRATRRVLERMSNIYKILQETFLGLRVVKAFTMEPYERRRFREATQDYFHRSMRVIILDALAGPIIELLGIAAITLALLAGCYLVLRHETQIFGISLCPPDRWSRRNCSSFM